MKTAKMIFLSLLILPLRASDESLTGAHSQRENSHRKVTWRDLLYANLYREKGLISSEEYDILQSIKTPRKESFEQESSKPIQSVQYISDDTKNEIKEDLLDFLGKEDEGAEEGKA